MCVFGAGKGRRLNICAFWRNKTCRKKFCTSSCSLWLYKDETFHFHSSAFWVLLTSTTDTASIVVVVEVEEELVEAGDILSAFKA